MLFVRKQGKCKDIVNLSNSEFSSKKQKFNTYSFKVRKNEKKSKIIVESE